MILYICQNKYATLEKVFEIFETFYKESISLGINNFYQYNFYEHSSVKNYRNKQTTNKRILSCLQANKSCTLTSRQRNANLGRIRICFKTKQTSKDELAWSWVNGQILNIAHMRVSVQPFLQLVGK